LSTLSRDAFSCADEHWNCDRGERNVGTPPPICLFGRAPPPLCTPNIFERVSRAPRGRNYYQPPFSSSAWRLFPQSNRHLVEQAKSLAPMGPSNSHSDHQTLLFLRRRPFPEGRRRDGPRDLLRKDVSPLFAERSLVALKQCKVPFHHLPPLFSLCF